MDDRPSRLGRNFGIYFCFFSGAVFLIYILRYRKLIPFSIAKSTDSWQISNELPCMYLGLEAVPIYTRKAFPVVRVLVFSVPVDRVIKNLVDDEFLRRCFVIFLL